MAMAGHATAHAMIAHRSAPSASSSSSRHDGGSSSSAAMMSSSSKSASSGSSHSMHHSSSYATLSSSSSSSSRRYTPASSSSNTFPSPATSTTSSASSIRTPPDLLLNGNALGSTWKPTVQAKDEKPLPRHLEPDEITKHLNLITSIVRTSLPRTLPSPPGSPRLTARRVDEPGRDRSRDRTGREMEANPLTKRRDETRGSERDAEADSDSRSSSKRLRRASPSPQRSSPNRPSQSPRNRSPPPRQTWTRERFNEVAAACRHKGRELKHRGDHRLRDASAPQSHHSPQHAAQLAALEQTDAILLYTYGFWCEDQASPKETPCIAANWTTLFGLLKYVYSCHERQGSTVLAGLCRLLEALVLNHLANHELRLVQYRTSKAAANAAAIANSPSSRSREASASSPAITGGSGDHSTSGGASSGPDPATTLSDLNRSMSKIVADLDRSNRIFGQATSMLSRRALTRSFPETWDACASSDLEAADKMLAEALDPGSLGKTARDDPPQFAWAWPINHLTPFPHTVCFGRALVREASRKLGFNYQPGRIA